MKAARDLTGPGARVSQGQRLYSNNMDIQMNGAMRSDPNDVAIVGTLMKLVNEPVVLADPDGIIVGWSSGAEQLLGYRADEILGTRCADLYAEDERQAHRERCGNTLLGAIQPEIHAAIRMQAGTLRLVRCRLSIIRDSAGNPAGTLSRFIASAGGPSAHEVCYPQAPELLTLIDSGPFLFAHVDANRRYLYMNKFGRRLNSIDTDDVAGRHVRDVLGEPLYQQLLPRIDEVLAGGVTTGEFSVRLPDNSTHHFFDYLVPQRAADGTVKGYFVVVLDVTAAKVAHEAQLFREQQLRGTLIREVHHRVKNSLQGVIGMMRTQALRHPEASGAIDPAISQLMALSVAFGLASRHGTSGVLLCDLVSDIAHNVEQTTQRSIDVQLSAAAIREPVALAEEQGATMSLVINELIFNAIKHSAAAEGPRGVRVTVDRDDRFATLQVLNEAGELPVGFSLDTCKELGTGLDLVRALIPPKSCELRIAPQDRGVLAELRLTLPVPTRGAAGSTVAA